MVLVCFSSLNCLEHKEIKLEQELAWQTVTDVSLSSQHCPEKPVPTFFSERAKDAGLLDNSGQLKQSFTQVAFLNTLTGRANKLAAWSPISFDKDATELPQRFSPLILRC